jgi:hypothetical protein
MCGNSLQDAREDVLEACKGINTIFLKKTAKTGMVDTL